MTQYFLQHVPVLFFQTRWGKKNGGIVGILQKKNRLTSRGFLRQPLDSLQSFRGTHGRAHLFRRLVNVRAAEPETRDMSTGKHIVRDVFCVGCDAGVGWVYDKAWEESQRYKEGMYILEMELVRCTRS